MAVAVVALACSSQSPTPTTGATIAPFDSPTPVASATPVPVDVTLPPCDTGRRSGSGPLGTAPAPTPTPLPDAGTRDAKTIASEIIAYLTSASPITHHLVSWNGLFNSKWTEDATPAQQAAALELLGIRAAQACDAVRQITHFPPEVAGFDSQLREAARTRHAWAALALEELRQGGNAFMPFLNTGNDSTSALIADLPHAEEDLIRLYGAGRLAHQRLIDEVIGIEMTTEPGWLISADGLNPRLHAPFAFNRPALDGLGPDRWKQGTAVRVRRLRNPEPTDAEAASSRFTSLITQQGSLASVEQATVGGEPALRHVLAPDHPDWNASVTVFVSGDFTYFLETGCPADVEGSCGSVEKVAGSLKLRPPGRE